MNAVNMDSVPCYVQALNFQRNPFPVTPDAERYFFSRRLDQDFAELEHMIQARRGFFLVTGDVGVGKTTLTRRLLVTLDQQGVAIALIINTFLQGIDLLEAINRDFGIKVDGARTINVQLRALNGFLLKQFQAGRNCLIIIDDAQNLGVESLELLRQLSNFETERHKLVQILLVAQPEILQTLARQEIRQLRSRIALHVQLMPFDIRETGEYIANRLQVAGDRHGVRVTQAALSIIQKNSQGFPRIINLLMDRCLYGLVALDRHIVDASLVKQAITESHLPPKQWLHSGRYRIPSVVTIMILGIGVLLLAFDWISQNHVPLTKRRLQTVLVTSEKTPDFNQFLKSYDLHFDIPELSTSAMPEALKALEQEAVRQGWFLVVTSARIAKTCQDYPVWTYLDAQGMEQSLYFVRSEFLHDRIENRRGANVRTLQTILADMKYLSQDDIDGIMGPVTQQAIAAFQAQNELEPSGIVDEQTRYQLSCQLKVLSRSES
ncbi:MAG: AAA family ATPase [Methylococcales bacterium]|nr:AAA family ATPase [Methylococcales bacterium]